MFVLDKFKRVQTMWADLIAHVIMKGNIVSKRSFRQDPQKYHKSFY